MSKTKAVKARVKRTYAERQELRIDRIDKTLQALTKAAKRAPAPWGDVFRHAVALTSAAANQFANVVIPVDYKRKATAGKSARLDVGDSVVVRSKARRDVYRTVIPAIDEPGTITKLIRVNNVPSAWVTFGPNTYGPMPTRYLSPVSEAEEAEEAETAPQEDQEAAA